MVPSPWRNGGPITLASDIERFAAETADRARQLRLWREVRNLGIRDVRAVLVLWGPGAGTAVTPRSNGTVVVPGSVLTTWREELLDSRLTSEQISACWSALDAQVRLRDISADPSPPSVERMLIEAGAVLGAASAAFAAVATVIQVAAHPIWWVVSWLTVVLIGLGARRQRPLRRVADAWLGGAAATLLLVVGVIVAQFV